MPKNKMITKSCPKCVHQLAVACKTCPCGHNFISARQKANSSLELKEDGSVKRRRTERVKREKPNYYDALEYEKQTKKQRRGRNSVLHGVRKKVDPEDGRHRLKKKRKKHAEKDQQEEKDIPLQTPITPENTLKCFVILAELNRKMGATSWRV